MPMLSSDNFDESVVQDLSDLSPLVPYEAAAILEEVDATNVEIRKQLNKAGGTTRAATKTLVEVMNTAKDPVRLNAALKILELQGAQFKSNAPQQTLQVVVSSDKVNLGAIFNPRRTQ